MGRSINDPLSVRSEIAAAGAALAGADQLHVRAVPIHGEDLVTFVLIAGRLKNDLLAVQGEIGLGVLATGSQLADIAKVNFLGMRPNRLRTCDIDAARQR